MKISIGADERLTVVETVIAHVEKKGFTFEWYGPTRGDLQPWPVVAQQVAEDVAEGRSDQGILFCWTGTGISIAANKVPNIRAALCFDAETARGARLWNNANVLCLSMRLTSEITAVEILDAWFTTAYIPNPSDEKCLAQLTMLENKYRK